MDANLLTAIIMAPLVAVVAWEMIKSNRLHRNTPSSNS